MFKFTGIIMIVLSCVFYVMKKVEVIKIKYTNFSQMRAAITRLKHEMSFSLPEMSTLCKKISEETEGEISQCFLRTSELLCNDANLSFKDAWAKAGEGLELFSPEVAKAVGEFSKNFGKKTLDIELENLQKTEKQFEILQTQEQQSYEKNKKLVYTLGATASAAVVILFI